MGGMGEVRDDDDGSGWWVAGRDKAKKKSEGERTSTFFP